MKKKRIIAAILTLLFVLSLIFTFSFIGINANHECVGEECPICAEIKSCEDFLKTASAAAAIVTAAVAVHKFGIVALPYFYDKAENISLITLKVKLSN